MNRTALSCQVAALGTMGAILGVASLVAIGGLIFGPGTASTQLYAAGGNVLTITAAGARSLTNADVDAIARGVPDIAALSRAVFGTAPVGAGGVSDGGPTAVQGVDPSYAQVTRDTLVQGTFFTPQDGASANRVAVLGQTLSSHLFQTGQRAVGSTIRIRNVPFTVIGVLASQTNNSDNAVLIPFETGQVRLFGTNALDAVLVQVADPNQADVVSQDVEQLLRQRHQLRSGQPDGFTIRANSAQPPAASVGDTVARWLPRVLDRARQYSCEAKGLCRRAQPAQP
ncbi:MAG TPA: ABC transporter permease [Chloroflexota bacterium]|nr:ABC transporter permease [Chloroflexota bacterium]